MHKSTLLIFPNRQKKKKRNTTLPNVRNAQIYGSHTYSFARYTVQFNEWNEDAQSGIKKKFRCFVRILMSKHNHQFIVRLFFFLCVSSPYLPISICSILLFLLFFVFVFVFELHLIQLINHEIVNWLNNNNDNNNANGNNDDNRKWQYKCSVNLKNCRYK